MRMPCIRKLLLDWSKHENVETKDLVIITRPRTTYQKHALTKAGEQCFLTHGEKRKKGGGKGKRAGKAETLGRGTWSWHRPRKP